MKFSIASYNILANCLAFNLRPWFWYGYQGLKKTQKFYINDGMDHLRVSVFGYDRSNTLISFWTCAKTYLKIFSTNGFGYLMDDPNTYSSQNPSEEMTLIMHKALVDLFYRNDKNYEGDKNLAYELFDKECKEFPSWNNVASQIGITLNDSEWLVLNEKRKILKEKSGESRTIEIDNFNQILREFITQSKPDNKLLQLAKFVTLSDTDFNNILEAQKSFEWKNRCQSLIDTILSEKSDIWIFEELDEINSFKDSMKDKFTLSIFKQRLIRDKEDGEAIFYNPEVFDQHYYQDKPCISFVRYCAASQMSGRNCKLQSFNLPINDSIVESENRNNKHNNQTIENNAQCVKGWTFTNNLKVDQMENYDERIAVISALKHKSTNNVIIVIGTHLEHSQTDQRRQEMRKVELQQLALAIPNIISDFGLNNDIPIFLGGDFNDCINFKYYNPKEDRLTPFYQYLMENKWINLFPEDNYGPTTMTLSRQYTIDYIFVNEGNYKVISNPNPLNKIYLGGFNEKNEKILIKDQVKDKKNVSLGLPLCQIENQPIIPSDHLPIITNVEILYQNMSSM